MSTTTPPATMAGVAAPPQLEKKPVKFSNLLCKWRISSNVLDDHERGGFSKIEYTTHIGHWIFGYSTAVDDGNQRIEYKTDFIAHSVGAGLNMAEVTTLGQVCSFTKLLHVNR